MKKYTGVSFGVPYSFVCESFSEFTEEAQRRKAAGHMLSSVDCPVVRMVGFKDPSNGELIGISLFTLKEGISQTPGLRDCFLTPAARQRFLEG